MTTRRLNIEKGDRYGYLTIIKETEPLYWKKYKKRMFLCVCSCGSETTTRLEYLRSGHTESCGCRVKTVASNTKKTHGMTGTRLHGIWNGMKGRCYNKNRKSYKHYGEKGVTVCDEWMTFENFHKWAVNNGYKDNLTIERNNPFGNYEPSNCTWIPKSEQAKNKRVHKVENHV